MPTTTNWDDEPPPLNSADFDALYHRLKLCFGSYRNNDSAHSTTDGIAFPVHVLAVNALGLQAHRSIRLRSCDQTTSIRPAPWTSP